jgi:hypothetical protein
MRDRRGELSGAAPEAKIRGILDGWRTDMPGTAGAA